MVGGPGAAGAPASSPRSPGSGEAAERWRWEAAAAAAQGRPRPPSLSRPRRRPRDGPSSQSRRRRLGLATLPARRGGRPLRPPSAPKKARAMRAPCSGRPGPSAWSLLPRLASHFRPQDPRRGLGLSGRAGRLRDPGRRTAAPARRSPRPCSPAGLRRCFGGGRRKAEERIYVFKRLRDTVLKCPGECSELTPASQMFTQGTSGKKHKKNQRAVQELLHFSRK